MAYRVLADAVVIVHLAFIGFALLGGLLLLLRWTWAPWVHLPAAGWAAYIQWSHGICPLTPLENSLRRASGAAGYDGGFVEHYLIPVLYPAGLTPTVQLALAAVVVVANVAIYAIAWRVRRRRSPAV